MPPKTRSNTRKPMTKAKRSSDITTVDLDPPETKENTKIKV